MTTLPASHIGQYELVEQIGTGGMATVYKARQAKLDRHIAIKIMHQIFLSDNNFLARFEREARIVARLDHANIVPVYDYDDLNGVPYLVMKHIDGQTLKDVLSEGPLSLDRILEIIPAVASALTYAHSQGVLHRDVKPSNIIIDERGTPYLTDFGLARIAQAGESTMSADMMLGTPHYISPEQAQGSNNIDARADVYSLGIVLYELVVGRTPFSGDTPYIIVHKHIYNEPPHPCDLNADIPLAVSNVILKALAKHPDDRYATPDDLANDFRQAVEESGLSHLSDDRVSVSQRAFEAQPSHPPLRKPREGQEGQAHKQAMEAVIAQVTTSFKGDKVISIPSPLPAEQTPAPPTSITSLLSQETLLEVVKRFKEAITDIRDQLTNGELFLTLKSGAKDAIVEIQSHVEASGGKWDLNFGEGSSTSRRKTPVINREWSMEDASIRRRAGERVSLQRGFFIHAIVYFVIAFGLFGGLSGALNGLLKDMLAGETGLQPLLEINFLAIVRLLWGAGLISHGLDVFSKTGRRWNNRRLAIQDAMTGKYGENWRDVATDNEYKKARDKVEKNINKRVEFFHHVIWAVTMPLVIFITWGPLREMLNLLLAGEQEVLNFINTVPIPQAFALLMALTVVVHAIDLGVRGILNSGIKDRAVEREMQREREMMSLAVKAKNDETPVRLTEDGEFTESFVQDINVPKAKRQ